MMSPEPLQKQKSGNRRRLYHPGLIGHFVQGDHPTTGTISFAGADAALVEHDFVHSTITHLPTGWLVLIPSEKMTPGRCVTARHKLIAAHSQRADPTLVSAGTNGNSSSRDSTSVHISVGQVPRLKSLISNRIDLEGLIGSLRDLRDPERGIAVLAPPDRHRGEKHPLGSVAGQGISVESGFRG
jgi:hypothetical protein